MSAISIDESFSRSTAAGLPNRALRLIFLSLAMGLAVQALVVLAMAWQDTLSQGPRLLADAAQLLVWSTLTCASLAAGLALARGRLAITAGIALAAAPMALLLAREVQIATLAALTGTSIHGAMPWFGAAVHAIEFALLGVLLSTLARRRAGPWTHALAGAAVGGLAFVSGLAAEPAADAWLTRAIAEIGVAAGTALAVFLAHRIGPRQP